MVASLLVGNQSVDFLVDAFLEVRGQYGGSESGTQPGSRSKVGYLPRYKLGIEDRLSPESVFNL